MKKLSKKECDAYYKKHGSYHKSDPRHPMNAPATNAGGSSRTYKEADYKMQGGKMGLDPMYAKSGCKVYNNR